MNPMLPLTCAILTTAFIASMAQAQIAATEPALSRVDPPAGPGAMAPKLTCSDDGRILLTWLETAPMESNPDASTRKHAMRLRFSSFDGQRWSPPRTIVERSDFFANWADVPSMIAAGDGSLVAHWLQKSSDATYAYDVMLARSTDGGETWQTLGKAHDDQTHTEHGFVSLVREGEGVRVFWLDGREMAQQPDAADAHGHGAGNMTLRTTLVTGSTIQPSQLLDMRVCECCNTSAAVSAGGPVVVYRDRSEQDTRDIAMVRRVNGRWSDPRIVHEDDWQISACPVNGPAVAARANDVAVAWFTAARQQPRVSVSVSHDGGATFAKPVDIDAEEPLGRVALALAGDGSVIVCWYASEQSKAAIRVRRVGAGGALGPPVTVGHTAATRSSGFPSVALLADALLVVWTNVGRPSTLSAALVDMK